MNQETITHKIKKAINHLKNKFHSRSESNVYDEMKAENIMKNEMKIKLKKSAGNRDITAI